MVLRHQRAGWDAGLRRGFFEWLDNAATWQGGLSFTKYIEIIRADSLAALPAAEQEAYANQKIEPQVTSTRAAPRPIVKNWKLEDLATLFPLGAAQGDPVNGRRLFGEGQCFACHRFLEEGATVGPDLTAASRRFSTQDLLDAIINPSKTVSDQFAAVAVATKDGRVAVGRVVNVVGDRIMLQTDMLRPAELERIAVSEIDEMRVSPASMMPAGLLDTFTMHDIMDLVAFLQSTVQR
jgi:putative heme-binding domain-containing protein